MEMLLLSTPMQHAVTTHSVELDVDRLKDWLSRLAIMEAPEKLTELSQAIESFNEVEVPWHSRFELLEVFNTFVTETMLIFDAVFIAMLPGTLHEKDAIRQHWMEALLNVANGYKIILKDVFDSGEALAGDKCLLTSIYRAMELLASAMLYDFKRHESPAAMTYLEFHQLFNYAESENLENNIIKGIRGYEKPPTISRLYKQIILLSIIDPYRLNARQIDEMFLFLGGVASELDMSNCDVTTEDGLYYEINTYEDLPPMPVNECRSDEYGLRFINVWPLINLLGLKFSQQSDKAVMTYQESRLLETVINQLGSAQQQRNAPEGGAEEVKITQGIDDASMLLAVADTQQMDCLESTLWQSYAESDGHSYLECQKKDLQREISVGEVIVVKKLNNAMANNTSVGLVRWVRGKKNHMNIEAEYIGRNALSVQYGLVEERGDEYQGLYFPQDESGNRAKILIEQQVYELHKPIKMTGGDRSYRVQVESIVTETPLYVVCNFKASRWDS